MGYRLSVIGYGRLGIGYRLSVIGYGLLAIGDWLLDMGGIAAIRTSTPYTLRSTFYLYTLRFTLLAPTPLPLTSRLIASLRIVCQRQCFDADAIGRCMSGTK